MTRKRPRRREKESDDVKFGDLTPWKNPAAVYAYRCAVVGITPVVGLFLGPAAILLGAVGWLRHRVDPSIHGYSQSRAAVALGLMEMLFNGAGIACLARGFGWWG